MTETGKGGSRLDAGNTMRIFIISGIFMQTSLGQPYLLDKK